MSNELKKLAIVVVVFTAAFSLVLAYKTVKNKKVADSADNTAVKEKKVYPDVPSTVMVSRLDGLDEKQFTLDEYKGRTVLINFWATWCGPCKEEIPELIKISEEYKDKNLVVIGLNADDEPASVVKPFVERQKIAYRVGWANDELRSYFRSRGIPASYLINREGKLVATFTGFNPDTIPKKLRQVIEENLDN